ncbi:peptidylglycine alpha-hydroxylating monooxygenase-like [Pollicipes pollicipes]|nr:peptidylglycine alpha-hydroxylating monooxygenase-like [Pollicipes pollicipes]
MNPQLPQMFYPVLDDITLTKGDIVAARCTMNNYRSRITRVGNTGRDEMCNFYLMYWSEDGALNMPNCFREGPPQLYWTSMGLDNIPDYEASHLPLKFKELVRQHGHQHHG